MKIGIIADIHEDIFKLKEAIYLLEKKNCDEIVCLGDIIGYCLPYYKYFELRNAHECLEIVRANCNTVVVGNHDLYAIKKLPTFKAEFDYPDNWYEMIYEDKAKLSENRVWLYEDHELLPLLNEKDKEYLDGLPEYEVVEYGGLKIFFSHYIYPDLSGSTTHWVKVDGDFDEHLKMIKSHDTLIGFSGHAHIEGILIGQERQVEAKPFDNYILDKSKSQCIIGPCIVRGKKESGLLTFNTDSYEIEVISLGNS